MITIKPRTYNEIVRLARCKILQNIASDVTDEVVEEMYRFVGQSPANTILMTLETISFVDASGNTERVISLSSPPKVASNFTRLVFSATAFSQYSQRAISDSSGCSGCGGCSSNNNNNNNNNNG